jgi:hypothetical protein
MSMHCSHLSTDGWTGRFVGLGLVLATALLSSTSVLAQQRDPFAPENEIRRIQADPFAPENALPEVPSSTATAIHEETKSKAQYQHLGPRTPVDDRIDFEIALVPAVARRGETVKLAITGIPRPGFHTYPVSARTLEQPAGQLSSLEVESVPGLKPFGPVRETSWEKEDVPGSGLLLVHNKTFTWTQDILVLPDADPGMR